MAGSPALGVLVDLGGTLCTPLDLAACAPDWAPPESLRCGADAAAFAQRFGGALQRRLEETYRAAPVRQQDWRKVWGDALGELGLALSAAELEQLCLAHLAAAMRRCSLYDYTLPLLQWLRQMDVPVVLVSNVTGPPSAFDAALVAWRVRPLLAGCCWSSEVGERKPAALIFRRAAALFPRPPAQILMIGDDEEGDVVGSQVLGARTVRIAENGHATTSRADHVVARASLFALVRGLVEPQGLRPGAPS